MLTSEEEGAAVEVLAAAALVCPNKLLDGIPNAETAIDPAAGLDWPKQLLDSFPKTGDASKLPAVLDCPNKPLGCSPRDEAAVLAAVFADADVAAVFPDADVAAVFAGADVAAVFADADVAAVFAGADVAAGARLDDGRACEVDKEEAEVWKRMAVADAAGKTPGCGGFCTHITEKKLRKRIVHSYCAAIACNY